jgi:hypothetical protein
MGADGWVTDFNQEQEKRQATARVLSSVTAATKRDTPVMRVLQVAKKKKPSFPFFVLFTRFFFGGFFFPQMDSQSLDEELCNIFQQKLFAAFSYFQVWYSVFLPFSLVGTKKKKILISHSLMLLKHFVPSLKLRCGLQYSTSQWA